MGWSIPILRVAGIQLRIHITFLLLIAWIAFAYYTQGGSSAAVGGVLFILLLFTCVVLHEFGHALAGKAFGINTPDITLLPIGGVARLERIPDEPVQELVIAAAGPAVTALIALGAFIGGGSWDYPPTTKSSIPDLLFTMNVMLLLFNLLPAFPMDGGRVLRALLATHLSYARATQIAATVGQGFAFVFGLPVPSCPSSFAHQPTYRWYSARMVCTSSVASASESTRAKLRSSSPAATAMVESGVPSSWAAAAASAPKADIRCSRAKAACAAASASAIWRPSSARRQP